VATKIAIGEVVRVDASLIQADVNWERLSVRHVGAMAEVNGDGAADLAAAAEEVRRRSKKT
jgi:hypothetical protein